MKAILITGRTLAQGKGKERGKLSSAYKESVTVCEIDENDLKLIGLEPEQNVMVTSKHGSIVLKSRLSKEPTPGIVFVPLGPWVNVLIGSDTDGTGMPQFKRVEVEVKPAPTEKVLDLEDLVKSVYGGK
ncbi:MAG: molybdopterin dinucleotide binding domain-containing protein [Candidatus Bathyarchaeota archaeon]